MSDYKAWLAFTLLIFAVVWGFGYLQTRARVAAQAECVRAGRTVTECKEIR